jgi:hypothetical protein
MSIPECPHCHRRVIPSQNDECPSCGKNVADAPTEGNQMRLLVVRWGESFPTICFSCADSASRFTKVRITNVGTATELSRLLLWAFVPFGRLFAAFEASKNDRSMSVKLPICDNCRKRKVKPEVQSFDLERREIRLIVHEQFRDAVSRK